MATDYNKPTPNDGYASVVTYLHDNLVSFMRMFPTGTEQNIPENAVRCNPNNGNIEKLINSEWITQIDFSTVSLVSNFNYSTSAGPATIPAGGALYIGGYCMRTEAGQSLLLKRVSVNPNNIELLIYTNLAPENKFTFPYGLTVYEENHPVLYHATELRSPVVYLYIRNKSTTSSVYVYPDTSSFHCEFLVE